jgi:hypothetical protein
MSDSDTVQAFAKDVVSLAERLITPTDAFVIMSFAEKGHLKDAYNTFRRVCDAMGFAAFKIDHHIDRNQRIVSGIISAIRRSAFIIADVSEPRPNVYYPRESVGSAPTFFPSYIPCFLEFLAPWRFASRSDFPQ